MGLVFEIECQTLSKLGGLVDYLMRSKHLKM